MSDFKVDLSDSAYDFQRVVWPRIRKCCGGGRLVPIESVTDSIFAKEIDISAGIDAWQIHSEEGIRGIASRVQWIGFGSTLWNSFTVRMHRDSGTKTEYEKRLEAIRSDRGWIYPHLTVQAYLSEPRQSGELLSCAVAKTKDIIEMVYNDRCEKRRTSNAEFAIVWWEAMKIVGFDIGIFSSASAISYPRAKIIDETMYHGVFTGLDGEVYEVLPQ